MSMSAINVGRRLLAYGHVCGLNFFFPDYTLLTDMNINCTGCGGVHPRPGGSMCKNLAFTRNIGRKYDSTGTVRGGAAAGPNSKMGEAPRWEAVLPPDELANVPLRTSDEYLAFCEKVIADLSHKLEASEEEEKVRNAERKISELMSQLQLNDLGHHWLKYDVSQGILRHR